MVPVPILLVTGFLGAGKTTVVNHLLAHAEGRRIAAVVNDFGAINIDAELIAGASDGVVSLSNGCICCSLEGDLLRTLATLLRRDPRPEFIVIETSGVADPSDIVRNLMDPMIWQEAPLETVLCVVDATTDGGDVERRVAAVSIAGGRRGGAEQGGPGRRGGSRATARSRPGTAAGGGGGRCAAWRGAGSAAVSRGRGPRADAARGEPAAAGGRPVRDAELDIGTASVAAPVTAGDRRLAPKLARAKGLFETVEQPGRLTVFQLAGGRATLAPGGALRGRGAANTDRLHCRARRSLARRDRQHHGFVCRSRMM